MAATTTGQSTGDKDGGTRRGRSAPKLTAAEVAGLAVEQVTDLTGREPIGIVGVEAGDDGWQAEVEVVESRRIPSSADMLATYSAELDTDGDLTSCRRVSRYLRGSGYSGDGGR